MLPEDKEAGCLSFLFFFLCNKAGKKKSQENGMEGKTSELQCRYHHLLLQNRLFLICKALGAVNWDFPIKCAKLKGMKIVTDPDLLLPRTFVLATAHNAQTKSCIHHLIPFTLYPGLCRKLCLRNIQKLKMNFIPEYKNKPPVSNARISAAKPFLWGIFPQVPTIGLQDQSQKYNRKEKDEAHTQ